MLLNEHIPTIRFTELQQYDLFQVLYHYITTSLRLHVSLDRNALMIDLVWIHPFAMVDFGFMLGGQIEFALALAVYQSILVLITN